MKIVIEKPNSLYREVEVSPAMEAHWNIPINHAQTILDQINGGMYRKLFLGKKDLVCMDFGANVGLVSLYMLPACKYLMAVEPTPSHYKLMDELLSANIGECMLLKSSNALTGEAGKFLFSTGHGTENKITSQEGYGNGKIEVTGKTLYQHIQMFESAFMAQLTIDFCKVDIEGGEMMALTEEQILLAHGKVKTFFVEVHPAFGGGMDENREELIRRFKKVGYNIETIDYQTFIAHD